MTPIKEVSVGKFCRSEYGIVYIYKNNFKDNYAVFPVEGTVPTDKKFAHKVYVYKRVKKEWITKATERLEKLFEGGESQRVSNNILEDVEIRLDNLSYIENLAILKSYNV